LETVFSERKKQTADAAGFVIDEVNDVGVCQSYADAASVLV
jgi:hypothetical protein